MKLNTSLEVNNVPREALDYSYIVVKVVDTELWYHGADNDKEKATEIARTLENGFVLNKP